MFRNIHSNKYLPYCLLDEITFNFVEAKKTSLKRSQIIAVYRNWDYGIVQITM